MQNIKYQIKFLILFLVFSFSFLILTMSVFGQTVATEESPVGVLRGIVCTSSNWLCKTEDTVLPDVLCCWWHCLPKEILPPHQCPTNKDWGQKDGTGQTGNSRRYPYYDYDLETIIEVPPVLPAIISPSPLPPTTCNSPSGWPVASRQVSLSYRACHPSIPNLGIIGEGCHTGIDISASAGSAVTTTLSGKIVFSGNQGGYGNTVMVSCENGEYTVGFSHLKDIKVSVNDLVVAGQTIVGTVGSTGASTAAHLHYRVWQGNNLVNPGIYMPYTGCVDWTQNNQGGGFCPGSGCTPQCPDTPACEKARQQGQCTTTAALEKTFAGLVIKIKYVVLHFFEMINFG